MLYSGNEAHGPDHKRGYPEWVYISGKFSVFSIL